MDNKFSFKCLNCEQEYKYKKNLYFCESCGCEKGILDVVFNYKILEKNNTELKKNFSSRNRDMWRYKELLPLNDIYRDHINIGWTPLKSLKYNIDFKVFIKDDSKLPSGSLKDRASSLAVSLALNNPQISTIAAASTGNAAAALACMCAGTKLRCIIYVPDNAPKEKVAQIRAYGAEVIEVSGGYDEAFSECLKACNKHGWYNRSTGINPFMTEGKKTVSFEICEQLDWSAPDVIYVPIGNGCIIGAVYKGFYELHKVGLIEKIPRIIGVVSKGSDYMYRLWKNNGDESRTESTSINTKATSISVKLPKDRLKALRAINKTNGEIITVTDDQIFESVLELARCSGTFAEPGGAASYAGFKKVPPKKNEVGVILVTGSGLKDISSLLASGTLDIDNIDYIQCS